LAARRDELDTHMQTLTLEMETARSWAQLNFLLPEHSMPAQAKEQP